MIATTQDLLQIWCEIYQEAIQFCEAIERLPEQCECGDAEAHLEGRCPCCRNHTEQAGSHGHAESCTVLLTRLRADLNILCNDFTLLATPIGQAAVGAKCLELRRGIFLAAEDLHKIVKAVDLVHNEVAGFRHTCDLSELRILKRYCAELRDHFNHMNLSLTQNAAS